jgi:hypothetical protein
MFLCCSQSHNTIKIQSESVEQLVFVDVVTNINILEETHVALASKRTMFANFSKSLEIVLYHSRNSSISPDAESPTVDRSTGEAHGKS